MSRVRTARDFVKGLLDGIPGWSFKTIPGGRAFLDMPDTYPGGTLSLEVSDPIEKLPQFGQYRRKRQLTGVVLLYAPSDGASIGDADGTAWDGADLVVDALDGRQPAGLFDEDTTVTEIETGRIEPFLIDTGVYGVAVPFTMELWWTTYFTP